MQQYFNKPNNNNYNYKKHYHLEIDDGAFERRYEELTTEIHTIGFKCWKNSCHYHLYPQPFYVNLIQKHWQFVIQKHWQFDHKYVCNISLIVGLIKHDKGIVWYIVPKRLREWFGLMTATYIKYIHSDTYNASIYAERIGLKLNNFIH